MYELIEFKYNFFSLINKMETFYNNIQKKHKWLILEIFTNIYQENK